MNQDKENMDYAEKWNLFVQERIAKLRSELGISAREMSLRLGQSENYINKIENHKSLPAVTMLHYICEFCNITPQVFYDGGAEHVIYYQQICSKLDTLNETQLKIILDVINQFQPSKE